MRADADVDRVTALDRRDHRAFDELARRVQLRHAVPLAQLVGLFLREHGLLAVGGELDQHLQLIARGDFGRLAEFGHRDAPAAAGSDPPSATVTVAGAVSVTEDCESVQVTDATGVLQERSTVPLKPACGVTRSATCAGRVAWEGAVSVNGAITANVCGVA